ncbi:hypothetical protein BDZ97DRAFT_1763795 [Flammula alnicola]|nr:hypothetical protein BDZ97DRAFT_1763795 [Flammula alnicola]
MVYSPDARTSSTSRSGEGGYSTLFKDSQTSLASDATTNGMGRVPTSTNPASGTNSTQTEFDSLRNIASSGSLAEVPSLKFALESALSVVKLFQTIRSNEADFMAIAQRCFDITQAIVLESRELTKDGEKLPVALRKHVEGFVLILFEIESFAKNQSGRSIWTKLSMNKKDAKTARRYFEMLDTSLYQFQIIQGGISKSVMTERVATEYQKWMEEYKADTLERESNSACGNEQRRRNELSDEKPIKDICDIFEGIEPENQVEIVRVINEDLRESGEMQSAHRTPLRKPKKPKTKRQVETDRKRPEQYQEENEALSELEDTCAGTRRRKDVQSTTESRRTPDPYHGHYAYPSPPMPPLNHLLLYPYALYAPPFPSPYMTSQDPYGMYTNHFAGHCMASGFSGHSSVSGASYQLNYNSGNTTNTVISDCNNNSSGRSRSRASAPNK